MSICRARLRNVFVLLNGWIHGVLDYKPALSRFSNALKIIALSFHFNTSNALTFRMSSEQARLQVPPKLNQRFIYSLTLRITRAISVMTTDTRHIIGPHFGNFLPAALRNDVISLTLYKGLLKTLVLE